MVPDVRAVLIWPYRPGRSRRNVTTRYHDTAVSVCSASELLIQLYAPGNIRYPGTWHPVLMSLHFSEDPRSKREKQEKQELFKRSLDDQRRMKQEASIASSKRDPDDGQFVPGLDGVASGMSRIPGLDHYQQGGGGAAPRFEGSASPPQEKPPYMSAVSDIIRTWYQVPGIKYVQQSIYVYVSCRQYIDDGRLQHSLRTCEYAAREINRDR